MIEIEEIEQDAVTIFGKTRFNSNNHWPDDVKPLDYHERSALDNTHTWIDQFHTEYGVIEIFERDLRWLKEAETSGQFTRKFPHMYNDEKENFLQRYKDVSDQYFATGKQYFVRSEHVSLKWGKYGPGPYTSLEKIIDSLCTCKPTHTPLKDVTTVLKLYLLPWLTFNPMKEYRFFVCNNRVTAISQQNLYQPNTLLQPLSQVERETLIRHHIDIITTYFYQTMVKKITHVSSYVVDLVIMESEEPYFIEMNTFGKEYPSGSSLFHWLLDEDKLYGKEDKLYFRYTV